MKSLFTKIRNLYRRFFYSPEKYARAIGVKVGKNCNISTRNFSSEPYLINIGNNVALTSGVYIHTHGGARVARRKYPNFDVFGKVVIKDWAYIGTGSQIMPGVTIGEGSLIAAGSIVCRSVPDNEVWGGNPARKICNVDEYVARNLKYNTNSKGLPPMKKRKLLESINDEKLIHK